MIDLILGISNIWFKQFQERYWVEQLIKDNSTKDSRKYFPIRLLCKKETRQQVLEYLKGNIVEERNNGDFVIAMNLPFERMWFSLLLGFGDKVEVLQPEELKSMLKEKAEEIISVY